ncbi:MAG TPA: PLP-dependent aminotransferase family protein [Longimicrobium sp.]|jgi:DNA-binding transcriptional MocR family regulator
MMTLPADPPVHEYAYKRLASDLTESISSGTLRPGDRIPSVRQMSMQRGLSIPTVLHAYRLLEARRVIGARPRSGFYVLALQRARIAEPGHADRLLHASEVTTRDLILRVSEMAADSTLIPLGTALPDAELLPTRSLTRALIRAMRRDVMGNATSVPPSGLEALRREIARRALDAGGSVSANDVVITCGCAEAVSLCLRALARPGDTVAVESPAYFGTLQALEVLGLKALEIPADPLTGIRVDLLAEALARGGVTAVVVTPNVHNPLGCVMPEAAKRELVALLHRYGVPAIEDETYSDLYFGSTRPRSLRAYDPSGLVLSCGSFSKTLAPAYRIGWAIPGRHIDRVMHLKLATTVATTTPPQLALAEYLGSGVYDNHLRKLRDTFAGTVERFSFEIAARFPEGTRISRPAGGFLLWVQLPEAIDTVDLQRRALTRGLSLAPGPAFSAHGEYRNYIRINAGHPWSERTRGALDSLAKLIDEPASS